MPISSESNRTSRRRELLSIAGAALVGGFAGCLGILEDDTGPDRTDESEDTPTDSNAALRPDLSGAAPYPMHQYGPAHVGAAAGAGPTGDVEVAWTHRVGAKDSYYDIASPAIVDGTVYVAEGRSDDEAEAATVVYALDGATGEIEWENAFTGTSVVGSTVVADGAVVQQFSGTVVALETGTGTERWRVSRDLDAPVMVADGTVYAIETTYADPPALVAFSLENGRERWSATLAGGNSIWPSAPAVVDGTVYMGGTDLLALSADTGERRWTGSFDAAATGSPTVVDDALYVPFGDGTVRAFDRDGTARWTQAVESSGQGYGMEFVTSPAVVDGTCYVVNSWQLSALDAGDGTIRWTNRIAANGAPVVADGVVYVGGLNAMVAHDGDTGNLLWRHDSNASTGAGTVAPVVGETVFYPSGGLHALLEPDASG